MVKTFKVLMTIRPRFVISYRILKALSSMLCQMVEAEKVKSTIEVLGECFAAGAAPADSFHCFSCGSFKEAYHASDDIVMKFCSCENDTEAEAALQKQALKISLFPPTFTSCRSLWQFTS